MPSCIESSLFMPPLSIVMLVLPDINQRSRFPLGGLRIIPHAAGHCSHNQLWLDSEKYQIQEQRRTSEIIGGDRRNSARRVKGENLMSSKTISALLSLALLTAGLACAKDSPDEEREKIRKMAATTLTD